MDYQKIYEQAKLKEGSDERLLEILSRDIFWILADEAKKYKDEILPYSREEVKSAIQNSAIIVVDHPNLKFR
jgi:hypothetical protein